MLDLKSLHPIDYLRILWRRRWYALAVFLLCCIGGAAYAWRRPDIYTSSARIRVEPPSISQEYVRPSVRLNPQEQIASIRSMVQSRSFLQRIVQDFQLFGYGAGSDFSMEEAIKSVSNGISITSTAKDSISIGFDSTDPQLAQNLTRRMVETLIQSNTSSRKAIAVATDQFVNEQLKQTQSGLDSVEEKIKQFKMQHLGALPQQSEANLGALSRLDIQLLSIENALQDLQERKRLLGVVAQNREKMVDLNRDILFPEKELPEESAEFSAISRQLEAKRAELSALSLKYTPQYPDVVRTAKEVESLELILFKEKEKAAQLAKEMKPFDDPERAALTAAKSQGLDILPSVSDYESESIKNEISKKEKERETILREIKKVQARINLAPALEQQLLALSREHDTLRRQYENLQSKRFQAQMTTTLENSDANDIYRVVDEANLPESPSAPNRIHIIMLGIAAGFVFGIGIAFGLEYLDTTFGTEEEVAKVLRLPVLVSISEIPTKEPGRLLKAGQMPKGA